MHKVRFSRVFRDEDDGAPTFVNSKKYCNISHMYYNADPYNSEEVELMELSGPSTNKVSLMDATHSLGQDTEKYEYEYEY